MVIPPRECLPKVCNSKGGGNISTESKESGGGGSGGGSACSRNLSSSNTTPTKEYDRTRGTCTLDRSSSGVGGTPIDARRGGRAGGAKKWPGNHNTLHTTLSSPPSPLSPSSSHCSPSLVRKRFNFTMSCSPSLHSVVITSMNTQEPGPDGGRQHAADRHDLSPLPHTSLIGS